MMTFVAELIAAKEKTKTCYSAHNFATWVSFST